MSAAERKQKIPGSVKAKKKRDRSLRSQKTQRECLFPMAVTWLHISDFHIRAGDSYDRNVVFDALVQSVGRFRAEENRNPDLIFATGDIAHSGQAEEYDIATKFFDQILEAAGLTRHRLYIIPGNHDVDRKRIIGLARTLNSGSEADQYFAPGAKKHHREAIEPYLKWHDTYFSGIRSAPHDSTCGPVEIVEAGGHKLAILPINSAFFAKTTTTTRSCLLEALHRRSCEGT